MPATSSERIKAVLAAPVPPSGRGWAELPGFTYTIKVPDTSEEEFLKFFASTMLRLYAIAVSRQLAPTGELQFVTLCKFARNGQALKFLSYAPFPELVDFMNATLRSKNVARELPKLLDSFDGEIERRCAFPMDVWLPVAVVFDTAKKHVLFSNINQIQSPDQFLKPALCRTTSGFLNFLGTLMVKADVRPDLRIEVNDVDRMLGHGLDGWIRWIHHAVATGVVFDSDRIFVNTRRPEEYDFRYG